MKHRKLVALKPLVRVEPSLSKSAWLARLILLFLGACATQVLFADDTRPAVVELREILEDTYQVRMVPPPGIGGGGIARLTLPDSCSAIGPGQAARSRGVAAEQYRCGEALSGQLIHIEFPGLTRSFHTVLRFTRLSGEEHTGVLAPGEHEWRVPASQTLARISWDYLGFGVVHILKGLDHLLFVLCLIWIAQSWRRILLTITGFTIAHSVTLALSALDIIRLATPPIEAGIALSVAFLASEVIRGSRETYTWRYPMSIACIFGLVHGLGFASVLRDIGLPQLHLVPALLSFNLGVEIGQVLFALPIAFLIRQAADREWPINSIRRFLGYCVGSLAAFWFVQRFLGML